MPVDPSKPHANAPTTPRTYSLYTVLVGIPSACLTRSVVESTRTVRHMYFYGSPTSSALSLNVRTCGLDFRSLHTLHRILAGVTGDYDCPGAKPVFLAM